MSGQVNKELDITLGGTFKPKNEDYNKYHFSNDRNNVHASNTQDSGYISNDKNNIHASNTQDSGYISNDRNNIHTSNTHDSGYISNSRNNNKSKKRKIRGFNKSKFLLFLGVTAALSFGSMINHLNEQQLINNTTYEVANENNISPSNYLSNKGKDYRLLNSPMFNPDKMGLGYDSIKLNQKNEFDNFLVNTYVNNGNYGIYKYIDQKIESGELLSLDEMCNLAEANKVFALSVMQEEFINSQGKNSKNEITYASYSIISDSDKEKYLKNNIDVSNDYCVKFYDSIDFTTLTCLPDDNIAKYIEDNKDYQEKIYDGIKKIKNKIETNPNYSKSINYYESLIKIHHLLSESFEKTNTFAIRGHNEGLFLKSDKIYTKGVNLDSRKATNKMQINIDSHDEH